jgi:hypothetical protein
VSFAIALAFCLQPLVANLPLAATDDVTAVLAVVEPLGEEINGITKAPGNIDEMTSRGGTVPANVPSPIAMPLVRSGPPSCWMKVYSQPASVR